MQGVPNITNNSGHQSQLIRKIQGLKIKIEEVQIFRLNIPMIIFRVNRNKSSFNSIPIQIGSNTKVMMVINNTNNT
jgi:hypothetical protein